MKTNKIDVLSIQEITAYLPQKLRASSAGHIFLYESLNSTNITAMDMALSGATHGTTVIANHQTAGKGRSGKSFFSPANHGLYISFILSTDRLGLSVPTLVTALAAVTVCESIEAITDKHPRIKWVNDVLIDEKKICGILTESVIHNPDSQTPQVVLGIGINFTMPEIMYPTEIQQTAGSVFNLETPTTDRNHLAAELIYRIGQYNNDEGEKKLLEKYKQKMTLIGKRIHVTGPDGNYEATAIDIDDIGRLIIRNNDGELQSLSSGEVSILSNYF